MEISNGVNEKPYLSVIVPLYNEKANVKELHRQIADACGDLGRSFEIIFIDDGSSDGTAEECAGLSPLRLIKFRKNFGQTAAFDAGIKHSNGEIIVTMDGDLQNDPQDIKLLLDEMKRGDYDIVSGWRWQRKDKLAKHFMSRGANFIRKFLVKDNIHDSGCSLKAYKSECFHDVDLYGEMHRFIPAVLELSGYKVGEAKVSHRPRIHGKTKYNWKRILKGLVDMVSIWFWRKYSNRPLHLFGGGGIIVSFTGSLILIWMAVERLVFQRSISNRVWPMIGIFLLVVGIQLFVSGLLADIMIKNYYRSRNITNYNIKEIIEQ